MKTFIAYLASFIVAPSIGILLSLPLSFILLPLLGNIGRHFTYVILGGARVFLAVWIASKIFVWLGVSVSWIMLLLVGSVFIVNGLNRTSSAHPDMRQYEISYMWGDLVGLIAGAKYFL